MLARPRRSALLALIAAFVAAAAASAAGCAPSPEVPAGCERALAPGDLVITEVFADAKAGASGDGNDAGKEWFEIYNASDQRIELAGLTVSHSRRDGTRLDTHVVRAGEIAPGQYVTLGNAAPGALPPYVDYGYGGDLGDLYNTDGGRLALACGDREVDSASYDEVREGHARALGAGQVPEYTSNDAAERWCQASATEFVDGNFGTPGAENDCRPLISGQCDEDGASRPAVAPEPGDLVITEVLASPRAVPDATGEWFEVRALRDVDLNGVSLDRAGDHDPPDVLSATACLRVSAGSHVVFARSSDAAANGGLPAAAVAGAFRFSLVGGSAAAPGDIALYAGTTVIDAVRWTHATEGVALQLDAGRVDPIANDTESNFCAATQRFGLGDLGTPGAANAACPRIPPAGMCEDEAGAVRPIARPAPGELVISEVLANPANLPDASDAAREWFEVANAGATRFDVNELRVGRVGAVGSDVQSARCISVAPGGHAVFARSADPAANGGLPRVDATFRFGLVDTNGDIQISDAQEVLDQVRWTSVTSGRSRQLDAGHVSATDNDDDARFCAGDTPYGDASNQGTPGAANRRCP